MLPWGQRSEAQGDPMKAIVLALALLAPAAGAATLSIRAGDLSGGKLSKEAGRRAWSLVISGAPGRCVVRGRFETLSAIFDKLLAGKRTIVVECSGKRVADMVRVDLWNPAHGLDLSY